MYQISLKDILKQLKADLIGKDSYRGVTFTYSWLANQFGHIGLGFIPTCIVFALLKKCHPNTTSLKAAVCVSIFWLVFELYNFLGPLLSNAHSKFKLVFIASKAKYIFPPAWGNIAFDTITDLCFFWLGAFWAGCICKHSHIFIIIIIILCLLLLYPITYWYVTKIFLQEAQYPFQFRLSQWNASIDEEDKNTVYEFFEQQWFGKTFINFWIKKKWQNQYQRCHWYRKIY